MFKHRHEVGFRDLDQEAIRTSLDRGTPRGAGEERILAEHVAGCQGAYPAVIAIIDLDVDVEHALDNDEERAARLALAHDGRAGGGAPGGGGGGPGPVAASARRSSSARWRNSSLRMSRVSSCVRRSSMPWGIGAWNRSSFWCVGASPA